MAAPSVDRDAFLALLRQSGLVADHEIEAIRTRHAGLTRGRSLARSLVEEGVLTRFQAERLLGGRTAGFLLGPYRILDQLGRGGMGRVYKAEHRTMGRLVAIKVLAPALLKTERAVDMFLREVRAVGQLVHPNVVTAYDANKAGDRYYLVLEFVDGPNLDELVRRQGPLSPGLACDYVRQAALGLQAAHQQGMVHRDVKPANILVQRHGQTGDDAPGLVKVADFGLARLGEPPPGHPLHRPHTSAGTILTRDNTVMGTPDYLSPEQTRNVHGTDIRSDIYSLGCTFYFLLTGQVPFPGGTAVDKMIRHNTDRPTAVPKLRPDVPPPVLVAMERMIAKRPEQRFATPAEVAEALRPFAVSGPTPWAPPRPAGLESSALVPRAEPAALDGGSDEDLTALAGTMNASLDETPAPVTRRAPAGGHLRLALTVALSVVAGLIALAALAAVASHPGR